jgi:HSP20 family molecular chaperone IbpA
MKAHTATAQQPGRGTTTLTILMRDENMKLFADIHDLIARRAFEIYEREGKIPGRDLEHWFQAEAELLRPFRTEITEKKDMLVLQAEVPAFNAEDLAVHVEPTRLFIAGRRVFFQARPMRGHDILKLYCAERIYRVVDLPEAVDPACATATLGSGVLELRLPKVSPALAAPVALKAAA